MKKNTLLSIGLILFSVLKMQAQPIINPNLLGENAWLPTLLYGSTTGGGRLDYQWTNITASGTKMIRYGGTAFNYTQPPTGDYTYHVNKIKGAGMIPIIQVAIGEPSNQGLYSSATSASIVTLLNTGGRNAATYCKYWIIGNEPDLIGFTPQQIFNKYSWSPSTYLSSPTVAQPTVTPPGIITHTTYTLTVTNTLTGCTATDQVIVHGGAYSQQCCGGGGSFASQDSLKMMDITPVKMELTTALLNNSPNPFNGKTIINYSLEKNVSGEIRIINIEGKVLNQYAIKEGSSSIEINCTNYLPGIYLYSLITNGKTVDTNRMIITK